MKVNPAVPSSHPMRPNQYQGADPVGQTPSDVIFIRKDTIPVEGDLLVAGAGGPQRLGIGADGTFLASDGSDPSWRAINYSDIVGTPPAASYIPVTNGDPAAPAFIFSISGAPVLARYNP